MKSKTISWKRLFRSTCSKRIKTEKLEPLDPPHIHDLSYNEGEPLKFTAEFEVMPKIELSIYKGLEIERTTVEVKEEEVEDAIKNDARTNGPVRSSDRSADSNG